jgi:hypothetical protein
MGRMLKEPVMTYLRILLSTYCKGNEVNHEKFATISVSLTIFELGLSNTKPE